MIEFKIDPKELEAAREKLKNIEYATHKVILPAVAEAMHGMIGNIHRYIKENVPLSEAVAKRAIYFKGVRLEGDRAVGRVLIRSPKHIPLIEYDVEPKEVTARKGLASKNWPGFTYSLRSGERRKGSQRVLGCGQPFIARMPGGHLGVYYRTAHNAGVRKSGLWGTGRWAPKKPEDEIKAHAAIKEMYGPDVQYHMASAEVEEALFESTSIAFSNILARYVEQAIKEHGGGA